MGFYIRKSVSVGPLRFNLSKSGIGVSTGFKGFRVGSGPRGNYVQMGLGGIYFRQTLPHHEENNSISSPMPRDQTTGVNLVAIESGAVNRMVDSSSSCLLDEINSKSKKPLIWPWILASGIGLVFLLAAEDAPVWGYWLSIPLSIVALVGAIYADQLRKSVVLFYDLEPHIEEAFQKLHDTFDSLRSCSRLWHIDSRGVITATYDWKVNAGAGALISRHSISPYAGFPSYFKCNIRIPVLPAGRLTLFFFPDRILVWDSCRFGTVSFDLLDVIFNETRFIEEEGVPNDARVVDKTWRFKNVKGGPDRRFSNNREIPIVLYEAIFLSSCSGISELFHASKIGVGAKLNAAIKQMASAIEIREKPPSEMGYLKCPCNHCDIFIEFPSDGLGQSITCPRCGLETILFSSGEAPRT